MFKDLKSQITDLMIKEIKIQNRIIEIIYVESLCSSVNINRFVLEYIHKVDSSNLMMSLMNIIPSLNSKILTKKDNPSFYLLNGFVLIKDKNGSEIFASELKMSLDRGISEPSTEFNIQGAKDSFTENYLKNVGLVRRRIKSTTLALEEMFIGKRSKTKVGIFYLNDVIDEEMLKKIKDKLKLIKIDAILDSGALANLLTSSTKTSFPTIQLTERPDTASASLLNGKVVIVVDTSPYVLVIPSFFQDYFHASEDYYLKSTNSSLTRILRFCAGLMTLTLPAFYIAVTTYNQEILPTSFLLNLMSQREGVPFPALLEIIIMIFAFEILKESDIRLPNKMSSAVSTVGGLVLGTAAVAAGIVSPIMIIVVALTAISSLVFSSIEMINAFRQWRLLILILAACFGMVGILFGLIILSSNLANIETFGKPYLLPFAPIEVSALNDSVIKKPIFKLKKRPTYLAKKDVVKERSDES